MAESGGAFHGPLREQVIRLREETVRLQEKTNAADKALALAASTLEAWKLNANEWRAALQDQRVGFVTRRELYLLLALVMSAMGVIGAFVR